MAKKKEPWRVMFSVGADKKAAVDAVIVIDVNYEGKSVLLFPYSSAEDALKGKGRQAQNRAFLTYEGVRAVVDELGGVEIYGRYLSGSETVAYIRSCREKLQGEELVSRIKNLVSTIGHKARAVDLEVLAGAAKRSLKYVSHDLSAFRMIALMGEVNDIMGYRMSWGDL